MICIYHQATRQHIPAGVYLAGYRKAKANPESKFKFGLKGWWPATGAQIVRDYRTDMHSRINGRGDYRPEGARVSLNTWGIASTPRAIIDPDRFRAMNRHQRKHFANRVRGIEQ